MTVDPLFVHIEGLQGDAPWGHVLDAGTGRTSLRWICELPTDSWTAVTGDAGRARTLKQAYAAQIRPHDKLVVGNWTDPSLLYGETYDVVLADYLLGALEGHAPYYQDRLFDRLRPLVRQRLYCVGLAPYAETAPHPWGAAILDIVRLRDACILLSGGRTYREYPATWVTRNLERAGLVVEDVHSRPIRYRARFVNEQLNNAVRCLPKIADQALAAQLKDSIAALREQALGLYEAGSAQPFGEDWVVYARPRQRS